MPGNQRIVSSTVAAPLLLTLGLLGVTGCRQDMHNQPKFYPQRGTDPTQIFKDGRSVRPQVEDTVARGQLHENSYLYTGMQNGQEGTMMPFPVTTDVLARGQEQYNVFCTPCHSRVGNGVGMIVTRGYAQAGNFHTARLQNAPLGHFFTVITNGYGAMPNYAAQLTPENRWAVVAYVRALQLSQNAQQADIASGQHVEPLADIAEREGFSRSFAADWTLPPTAVTGTPDKQPYVLPTELNNGQGHGNNPATRTITSPVTINGSGVPAGHGQSSTGYPDIPVSPKQPE